MEKSKIIIKRETKITSCTELSLYQDLVVNDKGKTCLEQLDVEKHRVYKVPPTKCTNCKTNNIQGLEVLGAYDGLLFWICDKCNELFLIFDPDTTEQFLLIGKECWTNREDWKKPSESEIH